MTLSIDHGTWVVVADGDQHLVLRNEGDAELADLRVVDHDDQKNPPDREQATDKPGRRRDDGEHGRSAMDETDFHEKAKEDFAKELAEDLSKKALNNVYEKLVLVADPSTLGILRDNLHDEAKKRVTDEVAKTLTNHSPSDIQRILCGKNEPT